MAVTRAGRMSALFLAVFLFASSVGALVLVIVQGSDGASQADLQEMINQQANMKEECSVDPAKNTTSKVDPGKPLKLTSKVEKLQIIDTKEGNGEAVQLGDCVTVNYRLSLGDGSVVDGNDTFAAGEPIAFDLIEGGLIQGWTAGLPGAKVGGLRRLVIPSNMAYGEAGNAGIPPNTDLVFDIEIVDIKR